MCQCHKYRYAHQKLLYFSVKERLLKQAEEFDQVNELLQTVLDEADAEYETRVQKSIEEAAKRRKREQKLKAYDFKEPPMEVVVRPEARRRVSGSPPCITSAGSPTSAPQTGLTWGRCPAT